jgi:CheY-like chemotaxis protein
MSSRGSHLRRVSAEQPIVLLVDDNPAQLKLGAILLSEAGFQIETATTASEALDKAQRIRPDAIVSDIVMAGVDGFELCHRLRSDAPLRDVPVILLSSFHRGESDRWLALRVGASALVERTPDYGLARSALEHALSIPSTVQMERDPDPPAPIEHQASFEDRCRELERKHKELEQRLDAMARLLSRTAV